MSFLCSVSPEGVGPRSVLFRLGWGGEGGSPGRGREWIQGEGEDGREATGTGRTGGRVCRSWGWRWGRPVLGGKVLPGSAGSEAHLDSELRLGHLQSLQQTSEQHLHEGLKESPFLEASEETA